MPDDSDNHDEIPPCSEVAFPVEIEQELVWGSFDVYGLDDDFRTWAQDPAPANDGRHKIVAMHLPRHPDSPQDLLIVHSDDEGAAAVHTVRLVEPENLHPLLRTSADVKDIIITPERWFIPVTLTTFLDPDQLVPGDIDHQAIDVYGLDRRDDTRRGLGMTLDGRYEGPEGERLPFVCFASWEQMGVTSDLFSELYRDFAYGFHTAGPYPRADQVSGYILTARWGEEPVRTRLSVEGRPCCRINVLDTGFIAISEVVQSKTGFWPDSAPTVHFSVDGLTWHEVDVPTRYFSWDGEPRFEIPIWVCSVESGHDGGVIVHEAGPSWNSDKCSRGSYWKADEDLTNWRKLLAVPSGFGEKADN